MADKIEFWFDPSCPWCWMTSRWIADEIVPNRDVEVTWHVLSLNYLNRGRDLDARYAKMMDDALLGAQVSVGVGEVYGQEALGNFYTEVGNRFHPGGRVNDKDAIIEALEALELDTNLVDRAEAGEFNEAMEAQLKGATDLVGTDVGVPTISVNGQAFFGPVVTPTPRGDDALRLFDGAVLMASVPGFYEIKRSRDKGPSFE
ncbi:mycothiol-dependent nitroreductase Rv2466c family protein [Flaviflexus massiliensis]|uniref:mycothiol-dependent nitroreductase Rv2466c family protein n=1 Tax=Flaviflexus massiliensis TaxID=1522309 RepID=UPI0006D5870B|nr:DsbA family protein [Flaviflexus massiliensis]